MSENPFENVRVDPSWSFADCTPSQTRYITHGYHTYPAKFIPQLAARLITELSQPGEIVVDPFMGSGTTIVEAMVHARLSVGVDINPVAQLIARAKSMPLEPRSLEREFDSIETDLPDLYTRILPDNSRIDYWFPSEQKQRLAAILERITLVENENQRDFFLVAFSQILKSCSIWLQSSIKPTRDPRKTPAEPRAAFVRRCRAMLRKNQAFWDMLPPPVRDNPAAFRTLKHADARALPLNNGAASLVVTSPPYVTSYEYADLHQLSALWLQFTSSLPEFRNRFIGSAFSKRGDIALQSSTAENICRALGDGRKGREVKNYFADMLECLCEMRRVLKIGGKAGIVIGDTELLGVPILNARVFAEQMTAIGFCVHKIIQRGIPSKILPQTRDPHNGRFTSASNKEKTQAYPVEYILVMERRG